MRNVHQKKEDFAKLNRPIQGLWDERGKKNLEGLPDQNQKELEEEFLLKYIKKHMTVLDVGCGNGKIAAKIAKVAQKVHGIDFSEIILSKAKKKKARNLEFTFGDVTDLQFSDGTFDLALSERCLINLSNFNAMVKALGEIRRVLKRGGLYLMLETSRQGIDSLSAYRKMFGLPAIHIPWHNIPIDEVWLKKAVKGKFVLSQTVCFGTYFFISRIIHPLLVKPKEPKFNAKINEVALAIARKSPAFNEEMSQIKIFVLKAV